MTLKLAILLFGLHVISAFTTLAFSPDSCEAGDVGCGDSTVSEIIDRDTSGGSLGGSGWGGLGKIWDGIQAVFGPFLNLIAFRHPWLSGDDIPEMAAWMIGTGQGVLALIHIYVIFSTLKAVLGRL